MERNRLADAVFHPRGDCWYIVVGEYASHADVVGVGGFRLSSLFSAFAVYWI